MNTQTLQGRLEDLDWTFAKTYADFAPHEYVVLPHQITKDLVVEVARTIQADGKDEEFSIFGNVRSYRYLYLGSHKYWVMSKDPDEIVIVNRVSVAAPAS